MVKKIMHDNFIKQYRDLAISFLEKSYNDNDWLDKRYVIQNIFDEKNGKMNNDMSLRAFSLPENLIKAKLVKNLILQGKCDEDIKKHFNFDEIIEIITNYNNDAITRRYQELLVALRNDMSLSFFWLAGSIIEGVLCEYCKKNNIKSNKDDIDGYITALENNNKISKGSTIYTTLQHFRLFRNTIHPTNQNNDFIKDKNLQNRKEELDDVIEYFTQ